MPVRTSTSRSLTSNVSVSVIIYLHHFAAPMASITTCFRSVTLLYAISTSARKSPSVTTIRALLREPPVRPLQSSRPDARAFLAATIPAPKPTSARHRPSGKGSGYFHRAASRNFRPAGPDLLQAAKSHHPDRGHIWADQAGSHHSAAPAGLHGQQIWLHRQ